MVGRSSSSVEGEVFPVWVSLARFFPESDSRARCVLGATRGRAARWLARRLRRTLRLPARVSLRLRGHLLPPAEPLALLQPGDTLEAIPAVEGVVDISREPKPDPELAPRARQPSRSDDSPPSPSPALPPVVPEDESLVEMKQRALQLLEQHAELQAGAAGEVEGAGRGPRRHRRVRRRRAPLPAVFEPDEPQPLPAVPAESVCVVRGGARGAGSVVRGGARGAGSAARCVRALSPPATGASAALVVLSMNHSSDDFSARDDCID